MKNLWDTFFDLIVILFCVLVIAFCGTTAISNIYMLFYGTGLYSFHMQHGESLDMLINYVLFFLSYFAIDTKTKKCETYLKNIIYILIPSLSLIYLLSDYYYAAIISCIPFFLGKYLFSDLNNKSEILNFKNISKVILVLTMLSFIIILSISIYFRMYFIFGLLMLCIYFMLGLFSMLIVRLYILNINEKILLIKSRCYNIIDLK